MHQDICYKWAATAAAEIINLHDTDDCKAIRFQRIQSLIMSVLRHAVVEAREQMLTPSDN
jgi:hypothetical protein